MGNKPATSRLTSRNTAFAAIVASGETQAEAYRRIYNPKASSVRAAHKGCVIAGRPAVAAEIERIRSKSNRKKLLTLNDRLEILADISQDPKARPHEKARAIEVYSKISGDEAPQRHEVAGPGGGPIPVAASVEVTRLPVRERIARLKAARLAANSNPEGA